MFSADELVSVHEWLAEAGLRGEAPERVFASFCEKLAAGGLPIRRAHIAIATLNTSVRAYSLTWTKGEIARTAFRHGRIPTEEWKASPFLHMLNSREQVLRRRLAGQGAVLDFPVLREFAAAGLTDWLGVLVSFHWSADLVEGGRIGMITSWATDDPLGFSDSEIAGIQRLLPSFAAVIKTATVTDIAHSVLAAYVGGDAARRVLSGAITRGSFERLSAALLFADLRNFTRFSAGKPTGDVVALLNDVFERVADPIRANGGEILKFIGDGLLATFLIDGGRSATQAADAALAAAVAAQRAMRDAGGPLALDIALHIGEVQYGNIGAADRLDFTVIGPAVNEVARLEELCGPLEEPILVSQDLRDVARSAAHHLASRGRHALRGIDGAREVFAPRHD